MEDIYCNCKSTKSIEVTECCLSDNYKQYTPETAICEDCGSQTVVVEICIECEKLT
jgi:hypothetical protein